MNKVILLSISLFLTSTGLKSSPEYEMQHDSNRDASPNNPIITNIKTDSINKDNIFFQHEIDDLKLEIFKLKTKQGFFGNFLDEQTARFSIIIAAILSIIGIFTYGGFKIEINKMKTIMQESISEIETKFKNLKDIMIEHELKMSKMYTEFNSSNMERYAKEGEYFDAFWFALYSAHESIKGLPLLKEENQIEGATEWIIKKLVNAISYLKILTKNKSTDAQLFEYHEHFLIIIDDHYCPNISRINTTG